jgi:hypothetical protein
MEKDSKSDLLKTFLRKFPKIDKFQSMSNILDRFIYRMFLPKSHKFVLERWTWNSNMETGLIPSEHLEVYHVCEDMTIAERILAHGFIVGPACNKGYGIYSASHGRYALNWRPCKPVIVCWVKIAKTKAFHSEIYAPDHSHEFVTSDPSAVHPIAVIEYHIIAPKDSSYTHGFQTSIGPVGCAKCDYHVYDDIWKRCDCEQTIDNRDIARIQASL